MQAIDRIAFVRELLADPGDLLVVTGLGTPSSNVRAVADRPLNFYISGAMGAATGFGLGLALARPERRIAVITGDAELMMNVGILATVGVQQPKNLSIVVLDNERFGATGSQESHTAHGVDLAGIATSSLIKHVLKVDDAAEVGEIRRRLHAGEGPFFTVVKVAPSKRVAGGSARIRDGVQAKFDFQRALEGLR